MLIEQLSLVLSNGAPEKCETLLGNSPEASLLLNSATSAARRYRLFAIKCVRSHPTKKRCTATFIIEDRSSFFELRKKHFRQSSVYCLSDVDELLIPEIPFPVR
jgi:hypothetical protein